MKERMTGAKPLFDPNGCRDYAAALTQRLDDRLAKEKAAK
jgi:metallo-beta-lactamase class B